ncbi:hypothetical protein Nepgr_006359 [Nepenthes gracilis]|uniref:Gag1-like clamp domain-containing protein n=1 Tax=Nepenthes gracilis TaxID=150966 RepID=A0AAD3S4V1_NEPGR|nr:hypothetical protein Nepgr_006359 [Nepenthes gracilis]
MILYDSFTSWINSFLACMGGCLGNRTKQACILAADKPLKGPPHHGRIGEKFCKLDYLSTTSTYDIDNSAAQSQRSISSLNTSNQSFCGDLGSGSTSGNNEFVNHGLLLWNQIRLQWTGGRRHVNQSCHFRESRISLSATYDRLLASKEHFGQAIPLSEMVDFLVDVWEQEGLYD